ncbi:MAG: hypothetical protein WC567_09115, partial [Kiritimatiellia bacterium]
TFPTGHLAGADGALTKEGGITPEMFICPTAAGNFGIKPASTLADITESNSCYNYFTSRSSDRGDQVIICDQNGPMSIAGTGATNWGLNHCQSPRETDYNSKKPQGGNIVKVAGQGMWVDCTNVTGGGMYITNPIVTNAFSGSAANIVMY